MMECPVCEVELRDREWNAHVVACLSIEVGPTLHSEEELAAFAAAAGLDATVVASREKTPGTLEIQKGHDRERVVLVLAERLDGMSIDFDFAALDFIADRAEDDVEAALAMLHRALSVGGDSPVRRVSLSDEDCTIQVDHKCPEHG